MAQSDRGPSESANKTSEAPPAERAAHAAPGWQISPPVLAGFTQDEMIAGRFKIVRTIGQGGMGAVYEAEDLELGGHVALKTVRPEIAADPRAIERFKQEIYLARKVTNPNVCRIFDLFHHRTPSPGEIIFVTMELLPGETLAERLRRVGRISPAEALALVSQMAAGLGAAHQAGVVHRDFKPGNVVLVPSKENAEDVRAVVTDFGLASTRVGDYSAALTTAGAGEILGTPAYMAPEQLSAEQVTPAADIYALGLVMYEMVTGRQPFAGDTPVAIALQRLQKPPEPPSMHVPDLDPKWEATILRCLERRPADRFASAADVARSLGGEPATPGPRTGRWKRWIAAAAVLAAVSSTFFLSRIGRAPVKEAVIVAPATTPVNPVRARRSVAVVGFKNLSGRSDVAWLSAALSEMLTTELAAGEKLRTIPGEEVVRMKVDLALADADSFAKDTLTRIRQNLGADLVVIGSYIALGSKSGDQVRLDLRVQDASAGETIASLTETGAGGELLSLVSRTGALLREKLGAGELSAAQAEGIRGSLPSDPAAARLYTEGLAKLRLSENLAARDLLLKAVVAEPAYPLAHSALAAAWSALGYDGKAADEAKRAFDLSGKLSREERLAIEGRYREMARELAKATEIYRLLFNFFPDSLEYGLRLAGVQTTAGKGKDALATIELLRMLPSPASEDPRIDLAEAASAGSLSDFKGQRSAAARAAEKAAALGARLLLARSRLAESEAFLGLGDFAKSVSASEEAKRIYTAVGDRGGVARTLNRIAIARRQQGVLPEAKRLFDETLATYRQIGDRSGVATIANNVANILRQQGQLDEAMKMYQESLVVSREIAKRNSEALALNNMAIVLRQQGDLEHAKTTYAEALAIRREIGEKSGVAATLSNIANVLSDQGDLAGARKMYEEALPISREIGQKTLVSNVLSNLAFVIWPQGDVLAAKALYEESLMISREVGDNRGVARGLINLADVLQNLGELDEARQRYDEALEVAVELGEKRVLAFVHAGLGNLLLAQGKFGEARQRHEEALAIRQAAKENATIAESNLALARLSIEEGRRADSERLAQRAIEGFHQQKAVDGEASARAVLARALLAQAKLTAAQNAIEPALALSRNSQNRVVRASVAIMGARLHMARGKAALTEALETLNRTLAEANKMRLLELQLEIRLAFAEVELIRGNTAGGRAQLAAVEKDAAERGFGLIVRKTAAARK